MWLLTDILFVCVTTGNSNGIVSAAKSGMNDVKALDESKVTSWQCDVDPLPEISIDASCLPLVDVNGESVLRLFWFDAFEDHLKQPGIVFLFGKVWVESAKQHVSCCVSVKNIERCVYLLPRRHRVNVKTNHEDQSCPVTFLDVYQVSVLFHCACVTGGMCPLCVRGTS